MFDISFSELMVIAVVALLVIGPEKLPKVARTIGAFVGRMQRYTAQIKDEVNREMRFEELQKLQQEVQSGARQTESSIMAHLNEVVQTDSPSSDAVQSMSSASVEDAVKLPKKRTVKPKQPKSAPDAPILNDPSTPISKKIRSKKQSIA